MPPQDERARLIKGWNRAAEGWARQQLSFDRVAAPVAQRMVDLADLQPGERVLELASGLGDTGLVAAAKVGRPDRSCSATLRRRCSIACASAPAGSRTSR